MALGAALGPRVTLFPLVALGAVPGLPRVTLFPLVALGSSPRAPARDPVPAWRLWEQSSGRGPPNAATRGPIPEPGYPLLTLPPAPHSPCASRALQLRRLRLPCLQLRRLRLPCLQFRRLRPPRPAPAVPCARRTRVSRAVCLLCRVPSAPCALSAPHAGDLQFAASVPACPCASGSRLCAACPVSRTPCVSNAPCIPPFPLLREADAHHQHRDRIDHGSALTLHAKRAGWWVVCGGLGARPA